MTRMSSISVELTSAELARVRREVSCGHYGSATAVVRDSLRKLFREKRGVKHPVPRQRNATLAKGYRSAAARDRKLAAEWAELPEAWPEK